MSEWIKVRDKLPPPEKEVLMMTDAGIYIGYLTREFVKQDSGVWVAHKLIRLQGRLMFCEECKHWEDGGSLTHWQPLPEPPYE